MQDVTEARKPWTWRLLVRFTTQACLVGLLFTLPSQASQLDFEEAIDLTLKKADLVQVLRSFAVIVGVETEIDPAVSGTVTVDLQGIPWREALENLCEEQAINCELLAGEPRTLRVRPLDAVPGCGLRPGLPEAVNLTLKRADLGQTLKSFQLISGLDFEVSEGLEGSVTSSLVALPWTVMLEEVCDLSGCRVDWGGEKIRILPAGDLQNGRREDFQVEKVPLSEALEILADRPIFGCLGAPVVDLEDGLDPTVSVRLAGADWVDVVKALVEPLGLDWRLHYGSPSRLEVFSAKSPEKAKPLPMLMGPPPGSEGLDLRLRLFPNEGQSVERSVRFNWKASEHGVAAEDGWRFHTTWIPQAADRQWLLPFLTRCGEETQTHLFEPTRWPLGEVWTARQDGMLVEIEPDEEDGVGSVSAGPAPCDLAGAGRLEVGVGGSTAEGKEGHRVGLQPRLGSYLLFRSPVDPQEMGAALVVLGGRLGALQLALLRPKAEEESLEVETFWLQPGSKLDRPWADRGQEFTLSIAHLPPS